MEVPAALSPNAPAEAPVTPVENLGGPADVGATMATLENGIANAPPYAQQQYDYYNKQYNTLFSSPEMSTPDASERENWILNHVQKDLDAQNAAKQAEQAKAQQAQQLNERRAQMGLQPLPLPPGFHQPQPSPLNQNDFAVPQAQDMPQQQVQTQPGLDSSQKGFLGQFAVQQKANEAIARAQANLATLQETELAKQEDFYKQQVERQEKIKSDFDTAFKERTSYLDDISKQMAAQDFTEPKLDRDRLWNSRSTGQKILAGIALFLGGAGAAMTGKNNQALEVMNNAIDKDVEQQKFNIQQSQQTKQMKLNNLKDQAGLQQNMLSHLTQKFGNDMQAESALRLIMTQQVQNKLQQFTANTQSKTVLESAKILNSQLEMQKQQYAMQFKAQVQQQQILKNLGTQDPSQLTPAMLASQPKEVREELISQRERSAPGWLGVAPTKEVAGKFIEKSNDIMPAINGAKRIMALTKDLNRVTDLTKRAQIQTEMKALAGALRVPITGPGALTEKEFNRLMDTIGNSTDILSIPQIQHAKLEQLTRKLESDLNTIAAQSGFRPRPTVQSIPGLRPYNP